MNKLPEVYKIPRYRPCKGALEKLKELVGKSWNNPAKGVSTFFALQLGERKPYKEERVGGFDQACHSALYRYSSGNAERKVLVNKFIAYDVPSHIRYMDWLIKDSPIAKVFVRRKKSYRYYTDNWIEMNLSASFRLVQLGNIMQRQPHEYPQTVGLWDSLVNAGVNPNLAIILADLAMIYENGYTAPIHGGKGHGPFASRYMREESLWLWYNGKLPKANMGNTGRVANSYNGVWEILGSGHVHCLDGINPIVNQFPPTNGFKQYEWAPAITVYDLDSFVKLCLYYQEYLINKYSGENNA